MKKMKLNSVLIKKSMKRQGITVFKLAEEWGITRQGVEYAIKSRSSSYAVRFGIRLGIDPKKLIVVE